MLRYHSETLQLLGVKPRTSNLAVKLLTSLEARIECRLPRSVREWYELDGACELLRQCSNDDWPVEIDKLGEPRFDTNGDRPHGLIRRGMLLFCRENQGVCAWAIQLDGSDDPPVVVDVDTKQFTSWRQCADTFSQYLYACAWDYSAYWKKLRENSTLRVQAENKPLSDAALSFLRQHFDPGLVTHSWPGDTQYRFSKGDQRILIWADRDRADWHLTAETTSTFENLLRSVMPLDDVGSALWSHTEEGESLLKRIRGSRDPI